MDLSEKMELVLWPERRAPEALPMFSQNLFTVYTWETQRPPSLLPLLEEKLERGFHIHSFDNFLSSASSSPTMVPGPGNAPRDKINKNSSLHGQRDHKQEK